MKVVFYTKYSVQGASSRLRSYQYINHLVERGCEVEVYPLFDKEYLLGFYEKGKKNKRKIILQYIKRAMNLRHSLSADVVVIEKELFPWLPFIFERFLSVFKVKHIVDYDDAIFHNYDRSNKLIRFILGDKISKVMKQATSCICGNPYLSEFARESGCKHVVLIPTVVDVERYIKKCSYKPQKSISIGWIGTPSTVKYLNSIEVILASLQGKYDFELTIIGANFDSSRLKVRCFDWSEDTEASLIRHFDIGIMPLTDSPFERGKCGYKMIQYMACGVPVIGSDVGVNRHIIEGSGSGFVVKSEAEWISAFEQLIESEKLRERFGGNGYRTVQEIYSVQSQSAHYYNVIHKAYNHW